MRIRAFKMGNPFKRKPRRSHQRFAWWFKRLDNGTIVIFEWYTRKRRDHGYRYGEGTK